MPRITISYRRDDSLDITGRIFDRLAAHFGREAVFRDIDSIPPGVDFRRHLETTLRTSDVILAIIGPQWAGSSQNQSRLGSAADPVRIEIETALKVNKPLIPVLVSRAVMPSPEQLPDSLRDFAFHNAVSIDSGQDFDVHIDRLIRAMERLLEVDEARATNVQAADAATLPPAPSRETAIPARVSAAATARRRLHWPVALTMVLVLAFIVIGLILFFVPILPKLSSSLTATTKIPFRCSFVNGKTCYYVIYYDDGRKPKYFTIQNQETKYVSDVSPNDLYCVGVGYPPDDNPNECKDSPDPHHMIHPRLVGKGDGFN